MRTLGKTSDAELGCQVGKICMLASTPEGVGREVRRLVAGLCPELDEVRDGVDRACRAVQALGLARSVGFEGVGTVRAEYDESLKELVRLRSCERELVAELTKP